MVYTVFVVFHVTVQHGGIRLHADLVGQLCGIEPLVAVDLVVADDVTYAIGKDFCTSSGK